MYSGINTTKKENGCKEANITESNKRQGIVERFNRTCPEETWQI